MNKTSIIILTKDCLEYTKKCINSLIRYTPDFELIVIDNNSEGDTINYLTGLKDATVIFNKKNMGSPYAWNQGIKIAKHDYIAIVDNDTMFTPNWLRYLQDCFKENSDCGAASPTTCFGGGNRSDKKIKARRFEMTQEDMNKYAKTLEVGHIPCNIFGFCFLTHKKVIDKIGVFDYKRYGIGIFEERDFFWRAKQAGFKTYWTTHSYVHHYGHTTFIDNKMDVDEIHNKNRLIFDERKKNDKNLFIENDVKI